MIHHKSNKQNIEERCRSGKKNETTADITAMLNLLGVNAGYFENLLGIDAFSFSRLTDDLPIYLWAHDEDHTVILWQQSRHKELRQL